MERATLLITPNSETDILQLGRFCGIQASSEDCAACETLKCHEKGAGLGGGVRYICLHYENS